MDKREFNGDKYTVGDWYVYEDIKFQIKEILEDRVIIYYPDEPDSKFMLYQSWMDVGCITEEEYKKHTELNNKTEIDG